MPPTRPTKIGKYDIVDVIGRGGMGIVYKGTDPHLGRMVAIKMMTGGFDDNPDLLKRFLREAQSTGSLQHPNIVTVYELGDYSGHPYLAMEYLEGESLDAIINSRKPLTSLEKIDIMLDVCRGLAYAHERGIVHRDIKPANIMVLRQGAVKIVDFGIAHIGDKGVTRTGQIMGSINYMSPEQINGKAIDARTDIFSAAVVLYQLFTYALPFEGESTASTLLKIIHEPPPPLHDYISVFPPELENVIRRALAKNREDRYATAEEFGLDLGHLQGQLRQEVIGEHLQHATESLESEELQTAKEHVLQVLKLDRQHTKASLLLREIQQKIQRQQANEQARQLRRQAEDALERKAFDVALESADRALALDTTNPDLQQLRDAIEAASRREHKLRELLRQAESAHQSGDLDTAKFAIEEAAEIAPDDAHVRALSRAITRDWAERSKQRELESCLLEARKEIASRRFTAALEVLKHADAIEPGAPQVRALMESASAGREQERRRRELEACSHDVEEALGRDDYSSAIARAESALARFPGERSLEKLKELAEKQQQLAARRQFIDQQLALSRKLLEEGRSQELVRVLEDALKKLGSEPRLESLLVIVRENVEREALERRKAECLQNAKDLLRRKAYPEAIRLLQAGCAELKDASEIEDLLRFAREEQTAENRRSAIAQCKERTQVLVSQREYQAAIRQLESALVDYPDEELQFLLVEVRQAAVSHQQKLERTLRSADRLLNSSKPKDAVKVLEAEAASFSDDPKWQKLLQTARLEVQRLAELDRAIGRSAELENASDYDSALACLSECQRTYGSSHQLEQRITELERKRSDASNQAVDKALSDARLLMNAGEYEAANDRLAGIFAALAYASESVQTAYRILQQQAINAVVQQRRFEIERHIAAGDLTSAKEMLEQTVTRMPDLGDFSPLQRALEEALGRRKQAQDSLREAHALFDARNWRQGAERLRQAFDLAPKTGNVRADILQQFVQGAEMAVAQDWIAAADLLRDVAALQSNYAVPRELIAKIEAGRRAEKVRGYLSRAAELRSRGDLERSLGQVEEGLAVFPGDARLSQAHSEIAGLLNAEQDRAQAERAQAEREAFVARTLENAEQTARLEDRTRILEASLKAYPDNPRLLGALRQTRSLAERVNALVSNARALEERKQYGEAIDEWRTVQRVYREYPGIQDQVERIARLQTQATAAARASWLDRIQSSSSSANYDAAVALLGEALRDFPGDAEFAAIERTLEEKLRARNKAQKILADARKLVRKQQWEKASNELRRAIETAEGDLQIEDRVLNELTQAAESVVGQSVESAELLARCAAELQPGSSAVRTLAARIEARKRELLVEQAISNIQQLRSRGDLDNALSETEKILASDSGDQRLRSLRKEIQSELTRRSQEEEREKREAEARARRLELEEQKKRERQKQESEAKARDLELKERRERERQHQEAEARARELELKERRERERQKQEAEARARELELKERRERERQEREQREREEETQRRQQRDADEARARAARQVKPPAAMPEVGTDRQPAAEQSRSATAMFSPPGTAPAPRRAGAVPTSFSPGTPAQQSTGQPIAGLRRKEVLVAASAVLLIAIAALAWRFTRGSGPSAVNITIQTAPAGAAIHIQGRAETCITPQCSISLPPGTYQVDATKDGYEPATQSVTVTSSASPAVAMTLEPVPGGNIGTIATPPPTTSPAAPNATTTPAMARLQLTDLLPGSPVEIDGRMLGKANRGGLFSTEVPVGDHQIKILARNKESRIIARSFLDGSTVALTKKDFEGKSSPPQLTSPQVPQASPDELAWQRVKDSAVPGDIENYIRSFPNAAHRSEAQAKLEDVYWAAASKGGVAGLRGYLNRYPNGKYSQTAKSEVVNAEFQSAMNSRDAGVLEDFLRRNPSGEYHDRIAEHLDDVVWSSANSKDRDSLQSYVNRFPRGRHAQQAQSEIAALTRPSAPPPHVADKPKPSAPPVVDEKAAVLKVIEQYQQAYENRSVDQLKSVWPTMGKQQINAMKDFFGHAQTIKFNYTLSSEPKIDGNDAIVTFLQTLSYASDSKNNKVSVNIVMHLKKEAAEPGTTTWQIASVR